MKRVNVISGPPSDQKVENTKKIIMQALDENRGAIMKHITIITQDDLDKFVERLKNDPQNLILIADAEATSSTLSWQSLADTCRNNDDRPFVL